MDSFVTAGQLRSAYSWTTAGVVVKQAVGFGISMLLARLLAPADFGLLGMVLVFTAVLSAVQELGLGQAVVYFQQDRETVAACFTVSFLTSSLMALGLIAAAPAIAGFYRTPALAPVVRWLSLSLLLGGCRVVAMGLLLKSFRFRRVTVLESISGLLGGGVAVVLAWRGFGVWSLVCNLLLSEALQTAGALASCPPSLTLRLRPRVLKMVLAWSLPLTGSTLCWQWYSNADYLIIGRVLGSRVLGIYTIAYRLAGFVNERIGPVLGRVSFPTFSALKQERQAAVAHWLVLVESTALLTVPLIALLAVNAEDLILILLTRKWLSAAHLLQILAVVAVLKTAAPLTLNLLAASGRTDIQFQYSLLNAIVMPLAFYLGCRWGRETGVALAWLSVYPLTVLFLFWRAVQVTGVRPLTILGAFRLPLLATIPAMLVALAVQAGFKAGLERLAACGVAYVATEALVYALHRPLRLRIASILRGA